MEIHLGEQKLKNIWVKITGMLQQNWAFIDADQTPIVIYFFDDNKMIFDQLEFESNDVAISGLRWNGFSNAWENKELFQNRFIYEEMTKIYKTRGSHHKPYSSGNYWKQPPDDFRDKFETVRENNSFSVDNIPSEETKHPKLEVFETPPVEEEKKSPSPIKWNIAMPDTITTEETEFKITKERIMQQIQEKRLSKLKNPSRSRKSRKLPLDDFDE